MSLRCSAVTPVTNAITSLPTTAACSLPASSTGCGAFTMSKSMGGGGGSSAIATNSRALLIDCVFMITFCLRLAVESISRRRETTLLVHLQPYNLFCGPFWRPQLSIACSRDTAREAVPEQVQWLDTDCHRRH